MTFYEYFQSYENYFWQWEENVEVLGIPNESTIAYRGWMMDVLGKLVPQGFPPFGTLLLVTIATNPNGDKSLDTVYSIIKNIKNIEDATYDIELADAICFLKMLSTVPKEYKSGNKRIQLFQVVFNRCHYAVSLKDSKAILNLYLTNKHGEGIISRKKNYIETVFKRDFKPLAVLNKWVKTADDLIKKIADLPELPDDDLILLEPEATEEVEPKDFVDELMNNAKTFHVGALIKRIWSGLNIPVHSALPSQQPIGGVSDLTNKGDFDKLLISEFANDDIVFLSRLANNEALYIRREIPPINNNLQRIILIDVSLKNWGTPKTIAYAIMLAIAKHPKTDIECLVFAVGETFHPISIASIHTIVDALQILEGSLNAVNGLHQFFKEYPESKNREIFIITENSTLKQSAMLKAITDFHSLVNYWIYTNADGNVDIYKKQQSSKKQIQHILLPLKDLWANEKKENHKLERENMGITFPILFRQQTNIKKLLSTQDGEVFQVTGDKRLFRFYDKNEAAGKKGWELIYEDLPNVGGQFEIGLLNNGEYILLMFHTQKREVVLLNITTKKIARTVFSDWKPSKQFEFVFFDNEFHYLDHHIHWSFGFPDLIFKKEHNNLLDVYRDRETELKQIQAKYGGRCPILKHVNNLFINQVNNLVFNQHELLLNQGYHIKLDKSNFLTQTITAAKSSDTEFVFIDGSTIEINKSGLFILKSSNASIPTIYIPSALEASLGVATENSFAGNEYFYKELSFDITLESPGTSPISIIKILKEALNIGLKDATDLVNNCPCLVFSKFSETKANHFKVLLESNGAKVTIKESNLWMSSKSKMKRITTQEFHKKYIQAFIKVIQAYGSIN